MAGTSKQDIRKSQKKKQRQQRKRKESLAKQAATRKTVDQLVDEALALVNEGYLKEGSRLLEIIRRKKPDHPLVCYGMGVLALTRGNDADAVDWFEKAVADSPDFIEAHFNLAVAYQKTRNIPGMILSYRHVLEHGEAGSITVRKSAENLSGIENSLKENDGIGLAEFLEGHHHFQEGLEFMEAKQWDDAEHSFVKSIHAHPRNVPSHGNLGIAYAVQGKKEQALAAFDRALEQDPGYEPAMVNKTLLLSLDEGESFPQEIVTVDYSRDFKRTKTEDSKDVVSGDDPQE